MRRSLGEGVGGGDGDEVEAGWGGGVSGVGSGWGGGRDVRVVDLAGLAVDGADGDGFGHGWGGGYVRWGCWDGGLGCVTERFPAVVTYRGSERDPHWEVGISPRSPNPYPLS